LELRAAVSVARVFACETNISTAGTVWRRFAYSILAMAKLQLATRAAVAHCAVTYELETGLFGVYTYEPHCPEALQQPPNMDPRQETSFPHAPSWLVSNAIVSPTRANVKMDFIPIIVGIWN
jgi:hypothetical protein